MADRIVDEHSPLEFKPVDVWTADGLQVSPVPYLQKAASGRLLEITSPFAKTTPAFSDALQTPTTVTRTSAVEAPHTLLTPFPRLQGLESTALALPALELVNSPKQASLSALETLKKAAPVTSAESGELRVELVDAGQDMVAGLAGALTRSHIKAFASKSVARAGLLGKALALAAPLVVAGQSRHFMEHGELTLDPTDTSFLRGAACAVVGNSAEGMRERYYRRIGGDYLGDIQKRLAIGASENSRSITLTLAAKGYSPKGSGYIIGRPPSSNWDYLSPSALKPIPSADELRLEFLHSPMRLSAFNARVNANNALHGVVTPLSLIAIGQRAVNEIPTEKSNATTHDFNDPLGSLTQWEIGRELATDLGAVGAGTLARYGMERLPHSVFAKGGVPGKVAGVAVPMLIAGEAKSYFETGALTADLTDPTFFRGAAVLTASQVMREVNIARQLHKSRPSLVKSAWRK